MTPIPAGWRPHLKEETTKSYYRALDEFIDAERASHEVYPPADQVFNALKYTPFDKVKAVILGQDPYHDAGQAHGLAFSVAPGVKPPPSLVNIFKELESDLGLPKPTTGCLVPWAKQGVLLLNAVLTVRAHEPNSHKNQGWEKFTDAVLIKLNERAEPIVFVLWGGYARKKKNLISAPPHAALESAHPSPLSVKQFRGSRPFSTINSLLQKFGEDPIDWELA